MCAEVQWGISDVHCNDYMLDICSYVKLPQKCLESLRFNGGISDTTSVLDTCSDVSIWNKRTEVQWGISDTHCSDYMCSDVSIWNKRMRFNGVLVTHIAMLDICSDVNLPQFGTEMLGIH